MDNQRSQIKTHVLSTRRQPPAPQFNERLSQLGNERGQNRKRNGGVADGSTTDTETYPPIGEHVFSASLSLPILSE
jgi:hypothetical protein